MLPTKFRDSGCKSKVIMMMFSISTNPDARGLPQLRDGGRRDFDLGALFGRVERLEARRNRHRTGAMTSPPRHLDAKILREGEEFEAAWVREIATLITSKRLNTREAEANASLARAATARLAERIEESRAITLDGLKVKARVSLWRRNGEPLEKGRGRESAPSAAEHAEAGALAG